MFKIAARLNEGIRLYQVVSKFRFFHETRIMCISSLQSMSNIYVPSHNSFNDDRAESNVSSLSQMLLQSNGCVSSPSPGVFTLLPYAHKALQKLVKLIDTEMESIGGQRIAMPSLVSSSLLKRSGRLEQCKSEIYFTDDQTILAPTHEEVVTQLVASVPSLSNKNLPLYLYQISTKFRKEKRPKGGILRAREFLMKDLYTFDADELSAIETYKKVCAAYERIFCRLDLPIVKVEASNGDIGGQFSHEYHVLADVGEDNLILCPSCKLAWNEEAAPVNVLKTKECPTCSKALEQKRGIEVGHTFYLGTRYPQPFEATFTTKDGKRELLMMGCFGLGVTRLMAAALEVLSRAGAMRWPRAISPFDLALLVPKAGSKEDHSGATSFIKDLGQSIVQRHGSSLDVLADDRAHLTLGRRLKDHSARGVPFVILAGRRVLESVPRLELVDTQSGVTQHLTHLETMDFVGQMANWLRQLKSE